MNIEDVKFIPIQHLFDDHSVEKLQEQISKRRYIINRMLISLEYIWMMEDEIRYIKQMINDIEKESS